jgi:hypothetical protein
MQPSNLGRTNFPFLGGGGGAVGPKYARSPKASLACPRRGRLHTDGRLLFLRIMARQSGSASDGIFACGSTTVCPREGCNMRPDRPTGTKATRLRAQGSFPSNESNPIYQDAGCLNDSDLAAVGLFIIGCCLGILSFTFSRTREGNGRTSGRGAGLRIFHSDAVPVMLRTRRCGWDARRVRMLNRLNCENGRYSRDGG